MIKLRLTGICLILLEAFSVALTNLSLDAKIPLYIPLGIFGSMLCPCIDFFSIADVYFAKTNPSLYKTFYIIGICLLVSIGVISIALRIYKFIVGVKCIRGTQKRFKLAKLAVIAQICFYTLIFIRLNFRFLGDFSKIEFRPKSTGAYIFMILFTLAQIGMLILLCSNKKKEDEISTKE